VLRHVRPDTKLALLDHVTSPTALVLPIADLVRELRARGVATLVDGAHAPGMVELDLGALGADFYTGNLHKWVGAPKGAAFLSVAEDWREVVRPTTISHGANARVDGRSRLHLEFDWQGTDDPTPVLCVPLALSTMASFFDGGWPAVRRHNRELALAARDGLAARLGVELPAPDTMIGSMAALPLPGGIDQIGSVHTWVDPWQDRLYREHGIEVPVFPFPPAGARLVRISAQVYNAGGDYDLLAAALATLGR
jgi:isopenicillin-N epimerase